MDVDNSASDGNESPFQSIIPNNDQQLPSDGHQVNGVSNGYSDNKHKGHKSEHRDKHQRDKDREKGRSKEHKSSSGGKDRDRDRDRSKHGSSSKDKDKDKERHGSSHKSSSGKSSSSGDKDKDKHRDRHKSSSSRDKDRDKDKDKEKEKDREHKSSKEKEHKSGSRDKDKERDRHRHGSSKDKHKDRHRDKDRGDKHSSSRDKDRKDKERKSEKIEEVKDEPPKEEDEITKAESSKYESAREDSVDEDEQKLVIKEETDSQEDEVAEPNVSAASSCDYSLSQFKEEAKFEETEEEPPVPKREAKEEEADSDDDDIPLSVRMSTSKRKMESEDDEDDVPLSARKKMKKEKTAKREVIDYSDGEEEEEFTAKKRAKKEKKPKKGGAAGKVKKEKATEEVVSPKKKNKKKAEEEQEVWKWWEEEKREDGTKWKFLEHKGPVFAPPYEPLPKNVRFYYDGKEMELSEESEEVAGFYARMLDHDYTTKDVFNDNFFKDWRKVMTEKERSRITDLKKCNFKQMHAHFLDVADKNRNRTKEEKLALKAKNEEILQEYGFCKIDGHKEKIGNFRIEPPGLFRGRGEHPKMGKLKRRVVPEDILINCSKDSEVPKPPPGRKWKEVRHDPNVTWLASWTENVQNQVKYIMLNPSSKLKGEKDWQKYETARRLHKCIEKIRTEYKDDWKSKEMRIRQRAVALYFIDKLALRAGNEKDEDQADTVGCCSLRVEHIQLHERKDDKDFVVVFDFLGKDSIRYYNEVPVEKRVFKNLQLFMENKAPGDDLFDRLNTAVMNKHLNELMEGLTAKVFRTYNASFTLQQQLDKLTNEDDSLSEKILSYNRANRAVAILCNHQRAVPKGHQKSMEKLKEKIETKRDNIADAERQVKDAQRDAKHGSVKEKVIYDKKKKQLERLREQLAKLEIQETDRDENKTIALGTSKLNYLDPRISVAWCKKYDVPIDKIYNKTQRDKFRWAIDMAGPDYVF